MNSGLNRYCLALFVTGTLACSKLIVGIFSPSFREISMATPTGNFAGVAISDIDKDGYLEVLSGCREKKKGLFLFSYKNSQWTKAQISAKGRYGGVELADVAGKGVKILLNNGNASPFTTLSLVTDTYEDTAIALGDPNADKRLDVVVTNHPGKNPRVFLCSALGTVS